MMDLHEVAAREFTNGVMTGAVLGVLACVLLGAVLVSAAMSEERPR